MPTVKFWGEATASNVWISEIEIGFPTHKFKSLRASTFDEIIVMLVETHREFTEPSEKEKRKALEAARPADADIYAGSIVGGLARAVTRLQEAADAPDAPAAPEATETATGHQAAAAYALPSEVDHIGREVMGEVRQKRQYTRRGSV